ncbi:hypothetical protein PITCH_A1430018 [uncultured Desulfobacterium sp.]|uniref:Uncharacterized protein n=1 Tax=uncultured Desulfobacterium sp. TaxID=201089 RepID=A0A445MSW9_9BACT|nr:hypothetical protein PITCH_A1430018 [uncultured Desulfobacterium sp.]
MYTWERISTYDKVLFASIEVHGVRVKTITNLGPATGYDPPVAAGH